MKAYLYYKELSSFPPQKSKVKRHLERLMTITATEIETIIRKRGQMIRAIHSIRRRPGPASRYIRLTDEIARSILKIKGWSLKLNRVVCLSQCINDCWEVGTPIEEQTSAQWPALKRAYEKFASIYISETDMPIIAIHIIDVRNTAPPDSF